MPKRVFIDAGPLVAFLLADDEFHDWSVQQFKRFSHFITCDAVLAEACARIKYYGGNQNAVVKLVTEGALLVDFDINETADRVARLMEKYADREMDFADGCLVAMTERFSDVLVVTLDTRDFSVYRRHEREIVPCLSPKN